MTVLMWRAAGERWKRERWWKLNSHRFPVLASFVKAVLCVPATSTTTTTTTTATTKVKISVTLHKKLQGHYTKLQSALCRSHWQSKSRQKLSVTGTTAETNEPWLHVEKPSVMRQPWSVEADSSKPVLQPRETRDRQEYRVRQNKVAPKHLLRFSQQPRGISTQNFTYLFSHHLCI